MYSTYLSRQTALICLLLIGTLALINAPTSALPLARLLNVHQPTFIGEKRKGPFVTASYRSGLRKGSLIRTGRNGRVLISFLNGTEIGLRGNSQLEIVSAPSETQPLVVCLFGALSEALIKPQGRTRVMTSGAIAAAPGTEFVLRLPRDNQTELTVTEGEVIFSNPQGKVYVFANQQSFAQVGSAPTPPVTVDTEGIRQWKADFTGVPVEFEQTLPPELATLPDGARLLSLFAQRDYPPIRAALAAAQDSTRLVARSVAERYDRDAPSAQRTAQAALASATNEAQRSQARLTLALAYLANNQIEDARATITESRDPAALTLRALTFLRTGDTLEAQRQLQDVLRAYPDFAQAQALLSLTLLQNARNQTEVAAAQGVARRSVQLAPDSALAHSALGLTLFFQSNAGSLGDQRTTLQRAIAETKAAVKLNSESPFSLLVYGRALMAQQNLGAALNAFQLARAFAPDLPLLDTELGNIYLRSDQNPRAEKAFRRVIAKRPDDADAYAGLGVAIGRQEKAREPQAEAAFQQALKLDGANAQARGGYALLLIQQGNFTSAEEQLRDGLGTSPAAGLQYALLSEALLFQNRLTEAGGYATTAVQLLPHSSLAHYQLGRVLYEQYRFTQAEDQFRQAATYDPLFADAFFALGLSLNQAERGTEVTRPLGSAIGVNQSGPTRALNLLNLQAAGAEETLQAALSDPTVIRTASRSLGNVQFDTRVGSDDSQIYDLSALYESQDKRGVGAFTARRNTTNGVRPVNADYENDEFALAGGFKAQDGPVGLFAQLQYETVDRGGNFLEEATSSTESTREERHIPSAALGFTFGNNPGRRTRVLGVFSDPTLRSANDNPGNSLFTNNKFRSYQLEIRHDRRLNGQSLISIGASLGRRQQDGFSNADFDESADIVSIQGESKSRAEQAELYARYVAQVSSRLKLTGEMRVERLALDYNTRSLTQSANPLLSGTSESGGSQTKTTVAPLFIAEYQPDDQSSFRFRVRRSLLDVQDFHLLSPRDVFVESFDPTTIGDIGGKGYSYDLEYDRSFGTGNFIRASLFRQRFTDAFDALAQGEQAVSLKGAQLRYEGSIGSGTTFFTGVSYTSATSVSASTAGPVASRYPYIPRYSAEVGFQYLSHRGWLFQPSFAYLGSRESLAANPATGEPFSRLGGAGVINLRVGRQLGLRFSGFVEVVNITDKKYVAGTNLQMGRQMRFGLINRF